MLRDRWVKIHKHSLAVFVGGTQTTTPPSLVYVMVQQVPFKMRRSTTATWFDPCCGRGTFLAETFVILMKDLRNIIKDPNVRARNIIDRLTGVDISEEQIDVARRMLGDLVRPYGIKPEELHLICADSLVYDFKDMKFDVIVGNPPFQPETNKGDGKGNGSGSMIWPKFIERAFGLINLGGHLLFVTPNNWRTGGLGKGGPYKHVRNGLWDRNVTWFEDVKRFFPMIGHSIKIDAWHCVNEMTGTTMDIPATLKHLRLIPRTLDVMKLQWLNSFFETCEREEPIPFAYRDNVKIIATKQAFEQVINRKLYPLINTSADHRKGKFCAAEKLPPSLNKHKVVVSDSGNPDPRYDPGTCGVALGGWYDTGENAEQFLASLRSLITNIGEQFCEKGSLRFPIHLFTRMPRRLLTESIASVFGADVVSGLVRDP